MTSSDTTGQSAARGTSRTERAERIDAIRYVVLRKLAPGLRHALMGELQAIQLSAEFAVRMLRVGADLTGLQDAVARIPRQCSDAVKTGRSLIEWLSPEEGTPALVGEGIGQCLKLAGEDWFLRGIQVTTDLPENELQVSKAALFELVVTALLVLTDMHDQPADFQVTVRPVKDHVEVILLARAAKRVATMPPIRPYQKLMWADLELLASLHGVPCVCEHGTASLQFQRFNPAQGGDL